MIFLSQAEVRRLLDVDQLLEALAETFRAVSSGQTSLPPRIAATIPAQGVLAAMPGYVAGSGLATKLVSVFPGNHERGLPSHQALIALFDPETGSPVAAMDGTWITRTRTAAASALATRMLARSQARVLTILGAGVQGDAHREIVARVRPFSEFRVASKNREHARALAARHPGTLAVDDFEDAVRGADVVCCCTDASEPILDRTWLKAGAHVTSVGASLEGAELDPVLLRKARLFVESRTAFELPPAGAAELAGLDSEAATELGEVLLGRRPGRSSEDELTVYKSMGIAAEDVAAARLAYERALKAGAGVDLQL